MSSFTSAASLRRTCFILSPDQENILSAHGPFLESIKVSPWERHKEINQTAQPARVKVFDTARIDTVVPLGATGHIVVISEIHQESPGEEYKVYASVVHGEDLPHGGYRRNLFVICTEPPTKQPCQPKVAVIPNPNRLLVLSENDLKTYKVIHKEVNGRTIIELNHIELTCRTEFIARPLFISPLDTTEIAVLSQDSRILILSGQNRKLQKNKLYGMHFDVDGPITALLAIHDMQRVLIAVSNVLYVLPTMSRKRESLAKTTHLTPVATVHTGAPVLHITVSSGQTIDGERTVATMESTCIRLWGLTKTSLSFRASIDFVGTPLSTCALIYRCVENEIEPATAAAAAAAAGPPPSVATALTPEETVDNMIDKMFETLDDHTCTTRDQLGQILKRCPFGDCARVRKLGEHLDECESKEKCNFSGCAVFHMWIKENNSIPPCVEHRYDRVDVDRTKRLCETITQLSAEMKKKKNVEKIDTRAPARYVETKEYDLLVVATDSGEVKFIDPAAYRTPSMQLLPTQPNDVVSSDIVAFCPAWRDQSKERGGGGGLMENLFAIYALSSQGQHVFRSYSGHDNKTVTTTLIANDIMDMASFVSPWGTSTVVAYGRKNIHLSVHRAEWKSRASSHLLSSFAPISQCFVHSNHFVVCTKQRMVFVATWSLVHHKETRGITAKTIELEEGETITSYEALYCNDDVDDLRLSIVGTSRGRVYSMTVDEDEMEEKYDSLQHMIDSPRPKKFQLEEEISSFFIDSNNERIVSMASRSIDDERDALTILGQRGTRIECTYTLEDGLKRGCVLPAVHFSPRTYRALVPVVGRGGRTEHLTLAHQSGGRGVNSAELLVEVVEGVPMMTLHVETNKELTAARPDDVFIHRSTGEGWDSIGLLTLHIGKTGKKKANKDSLVCFNGTLKRDCQTVQRPILAELDAVFIAPFVDLAGKRASIVLGVAGDLVSYDTFNGKGALSQRDIDRLNDGKETEIYKYACCDFLFTPDTAFLLVGCTGGEVMLLQNAELDAECSWYGFKEIVREEAAIDQVTIFKGTAHDVSVYKDMLLGVMVKREVIVYTLSLVGKFHISQVGYCTVPMEGPLNGITLIGLGNLRGSHDVWLFNDTQLMVWRGRDRTFDNKEEIVVQSTGLAGDRSAVAALTLKAVEWNNNSADSSPSVDLLCVGTTSGRLGWMYSVRVAGWSPKRIGRIAMEGVEGVVSGLAVEASDALRMIDEETVEFGIRLYILTARRVSVKLLHVSLKCGSESVQQVAHHHLPHFVRNPRHLSIEARPCPTEMLSDPKKKKKENGEIEKKPSRAQRILVTGCKEYEVLLMCPEKLQPAMEPSPPPPSPPVIADRMEKKKKKQKKEEAKKEGNEKLAIGTKMYFFELEDGRVEMRATACDGETVTETVMSVDRERIREMGVPEDVINPAHRRAVRVQRIREMGIEEEVIDIESAE